MSRVPLLALSAAASLVIATLVVVGGEPVQESAEVAPAPVFADTTLTTGVVLAGAVEAAALDEIEIDLTAQATGSTTTSISSDTSTTISQPATTSSSAPASNNSAASSESPPASTTTTTPATTTSTTTTSTTTSPPEEEAQGSFEGGSESQFLSSINSLRSANGKPGLTRDGDLNSRARWWAKEMADRGSLSHSNISGLIPPWNAAAENVGMGGSASGIFDLLAGSSGHRSNMLGDFTHVGIGAWRDAAGTLWTAHVFAR